MPTDQPKRPRRKRVETSQKSPYDAILERRIVVEFNGKPRKVGPQEALQLQTYQDALNGSLPAIREVLKWIDEREAARRPQLTHRFPTFRAENNEPVPMDDALLLLGIATGSDAADHDGTRYLSLQAWAVQEAIDRRRKPLDQRELSDLREHIADPDQVRWPTDIGDV